MDPIRVSNDQVLTVTADMGSYGTVFQEGGSGQWSVGAKTPLRLGPGLYRIETVKGTVNASVDSQSVAAIAANLPDMTERVTSGVVVAKAIVDGQVAIKELAEIKRSAPKMGLADKAKLLADKAKAIPTKISNRLDAADARLNGADARTDAAMTRVESVITDAENSAQIAEDVANQLTNSLGEVPNA